MNEINFLPLSYRQAESARRWRVRQIVILLLGLMLLGAWGSTQERWTGELRLRADALTTQMQTAEQQQSELARLRAEHEQLLHQVRIRRELAHPIAHTQILALLGQALPPDVGLVKLSLLTERPKPMTLEEWERSKKSGRVENKPDKPEPDRIVMDFEAVAPDDLTVANVIASLSANPVFENVKMHVSREVEYDGCLTRRFRVSATVPLDCRYVQPGSSGEVAHVAR